MDIRTETWGTQLQGAVLDGDWPIVCRALLVEDKALSLLEGQALISDEKIPPGKPGRTLARGAAQSLLDGEQDFDRYAQARRVVATFSVRLAPTISQQGDQKDLRESLDASLAAHAASRGLGDGPLTAWTAVHVSRSYEFLGEDQHALNWAKTALAALDEPDTELLSRLLLAPPSEHPDLARRLEFAARQRQFAALRMLRRWPEALRECQEYAEQRLAPFASTANGSPSREEAYLASRAIRWQADNWRRMCNRPKFREVSDQLRTLAANSDLGLQRQLLVLEMETAEYDRDWPRLERLSRQRLAHDLEQFAASGLIDTENDEDQALAALVRKKERNALTMLGNDWFETVKAIRESEAIVDPSRRAECRQLADRARRAWQEFGVNGLIAIEYNQLLLDHLDGKVRATEFGQKAISVSRRTRRAGTQVKAAFAATRFGEPGDADVLARLEELHDLFQGLDQAVIKGILALWWTRAGNKLNDSSATQDAMSAWHRAVTSGTTAGRDLLVDGVVAEPEVFVWAWQSAALSEDALLKHGDAATRPADVLTALMQCVAGIGRLYATSTTQYMQETVVRDHGWVFVRAADLCTELRDANAMTVLMETARRDRVGRLLHDLAAHPSRNAEVAAAAAELLATLNTRIVGEDVIGLEVDGSKDTGTRATALRDHLTHTVGISERVIGPLAALADPDAVTTGGAEDLLTPGSAVLQLFPGPRWRREDDNTDLIRIHRVLHWSSPAGITGAEVDQIDVPRALLDLPRGTAAHRSHYRQLINRVGNYLIPPRLRDLLLDAQQDHPLRLDVVPTGVLHMPFDALTIPGQSGLRLIDRAIVTLHGSITGALALRAAAAADPADPIAVYDLNLHHAGPELAAMKQHFPATRDYTALDVLDAAMTHAQRSADSVFAAGVHGIRGGDGWSHGLVLPDGGTLTAAHMLRWSVPRLAALPSCEMSIRDDSGEIAGLPYAMMLRGATTVVGTLDEVHDESTGQIMQKFWRRLSDGSTSTSVALRAAKLEWLAEDPARRRDLWRWAWLVNYGTH